MYMTLKSSCAKLLAAKFKLRNQSKVYKKFGGNLSYYPNKYDPDSKGKVIHFYKPDYHIDPYRFKVDVKPLLNTIYAKAISLDRIENCKLCGSDYRVEMHHVRNMSLLNPKVSKVDKLIVRANRKQIPLCRNCHMNLHK
jgi:hypothetical protein